MNDLSQNVCEPCRVGAPLLTQSELDDLLLKIPDWSVVDNDGVLQLERTYSFKNFVDAMAFSVAVGDLSEKEGHHPAILLEWGRVRVNWWTHKIKGLHKNDVIMAAKTDQVYVS